MANRTPDVTKISHRFLARDKQAGKFSVKLFSKDRTLVTARRIRAAIMAEGGWDKEFLDNLDFKNVEFLRGIDQMTGSMPQGISTTWRVYPKGEFGNRDVDYVWGYVFVGLSSSNKGIEAVGVITVNV